MHTRHENRHILLTKLDNTRIFLLPWNVKDINVDIYFLGENKIVCEWKNISYVLVN